MQLLMWQGTVGVMIDQVLRQKATPTPQRHTDTLEEGETRREKTRKQQVTVGAMTSTLGTLWDCCHLSKLDYTGPSVICQKIQGLKTYCRHKAHGGCGSGCRVAVQ